MEADKLVHSSEILNNRLPMATMAIRISRTRTVSNSNKMAVNRVSNLASLDSKAVNSKEDRDSLDSNLDNSKVHNRMDKAEAVLLTRILTI